MHLIVCSYNVTYAFRSESTLNSCLIVKEHLELDRCEIRILTGWDWTRTQYNLDRIQILNHLDKIAK